MKMTIKKMTTSKAATAAIKLLRKIPNIKKISDKHINLWKAKNIFR